VVVVGAGPAGSTAARLCAENGLSTCLIEEHAAVGYPVQCAGLLSSAAFGECEVSGHPVLHTITGARVVSSRGPDLSFDTGGTKAYVVDRGALDREMAEKAACAGADTRLKCAFAGFGTSGILTRGMNGRQELSYKVLIAADGPRSSIARALGMARAPVYLSGIQADAKLEKNPRLVELHPDASPEFFGWIIPSGEDRVRIGLCGMQQVRERFFHSCIRRERRGVSIS
jgi:Dehydrogenases (flavoproteins)